MRIVLAALLTAILTGLGTYVSFIKNGATRSEVRVMIAEEIAAIDRQNNETTAIVSNNQQQLITLDQKLDEVSIRLARIEAKIGTRPP